MSEPRELTPVQEERLARYRAGAMGDDERATFEREAVRDEALLEALYVEESLDALAADARGEREAPGPPALPMPVRDARPAIAERARRRWTRLAGALLPAAAAIVLAVGVFRWAGRERRGTTGDDVVRGGGVAAQPLEPTGDLAGTPARFVWSRDPGAQSYRVELFDAQGAVIATVVTADTTLAVEALTPSPPAAGEWKVTPLDADGIERPAAPAAAFRPRGR